MIKKIIILLNLVTIVLVSMELNENSSSIMQSCAQSIQLGYFVFSDKPIIENYDPNKTEIIPSIDENWAAVVKTEEINLHTKTVESVWQITSVIIPSDKKS